MPLVMPALQDLPAFDGMVANDPVDDFCRVASDYGTTVISGCQVTQDTGSDMKVAIAAGIVSIAGVPYIYAGTGGSPLTIPAVSAGDRRDTIVLRVTGLATVTATVVQGTVPQPKGGGTPLVGAWTYGVQPTVSLPPEKGPMNWSTTTVSTSVNVTTDVVLAEVYVAFNTTAITGTLTTILLPTTGNIVDKTTLPIPVLSPASQSAARSAVVQDVQRRGGSVFGANASEGRIAKAALSNLTNTGTIITVTTTLPAAIGQLVTIAGVAGITNINGTWAVIGVSSTGFTFIVTSSPAGTYTAATGTAAISVPVLDAVLGHSLPWGTGSANIGVTDVFSVLGSMENRQALLPDPGRGFRRCQTPSPSVGDTWSNLAVGSQVTASGPIAGFNTSWSISSAQVIGDTRVFRRAVVFFKRRTNGDGVKVSTNGGSTFSSVMDANGSGYFMWDSGDLGSAVSRVLQVSGATHTTGSGGAGIEVVGYIGYQNSGNDGAYNLNLSAPGSRIADWIANTDWDGQFLSYLAPLIRRVSWTLGINDRQSGISLSTIATGYATLINRTHAACPLAEVIIICEAHPGDGIFDTGITGANWFTYVNTLQTVAIQNNATFIDLPARLGDLSVRSGDSGDPYGITNGDGLHPADPASSTSGLDGQRMVAEALWERLSFSHQQAATAPAPGWTADRGTWTQTVQGSGTVSNAFTEKGNHTAGKFQKGTYLRWAEAGTVKYGVIGASTYAATTDLTTVSMIATADFLMTTSPDAGSNYYAFQPPPGFPTSFTWAPQLTGWSANPTFTAWWRVANGVCEVDFECSTTGTSNLQFVIAVMPVPLQSPVTSQGCGTGIDNGATINQAVPQATAASSNIIVAKNVTGGQWTTTGNKSANFHMTIPI